MNLKELRESKGLTQEKLARMIDVTLKSYINYENGVYSPKLETAKKLSDALGVTLDELCETITNN